MYKVSSNVKFVDFIQVRQIHTYIYILRVASTFLCIAMLKVTIQE